MLLIWHRQHKDCLLYTSRGYYALATLYKSGLGVEKDTPLALKYYTIAADKGHVSAMYNLAVLYDFEAEEQYRDMTKAIQYYQEAVDKGHYGAMNNLGVCYKDVYKRQQQIESVLMVIYLYVIKS